MSLFGAAHGIGGGGGGGGVKRAPPLKICHTCFSMMKLGTVIPYLKKKYINHVTLLLSPGDISMFYQKSTNFATSKNIDIACILVHNF